MYFKELENRNEYKMNESGNEKNLCREREEFWRERKNGVNRGRENNGGNLHC